MNNPMQAVFAFLLLILSFFSGPAASYTDAQIHEMQSFKRMTALAQAQPMPANLSDLFELYGHILFMNRREVRVHPEYETRQNALEDYMLRMAIGLDLLIRGDARQSSSDGHSLAHSFELGLNGKSSKFAPRAVSSIYSDTASSIPMADTSNLTSNQKRLDNSYSIPSGCGDQPLQQITNIIVSGMTITVRVDNYMCEPGAQLFLTATGGERKEEPPELHYNPGTNTPGASLTGAITWPDGRYETLSLGEHYFFKYDIGWEIYRLRVVFNVTDPEGNIRSEAIDVSWK